MSTMNIFSMVDTWNAAGTTFVGIGLNVTDTASAAGSALLDLQVGGVSQFKVSKAGAVTAVGVAIPTISSTSTLTNKTLSSPTINGTVVGSPVFAQGITIDATGFNRLSYSQSSVAIWSIGPRSDDDYHIYKESGSGSIKAWATIEMQDAVNLAAGTTNGTKIGTATSQKLGFFNQTPVIQPTAVADATSAVDVITQLNALLTRMRNLGLIAT